MWHRDAHDVAGTAAAADETEIGTTAADERDTVSVVQFR